MHALTISRLGNIMQRADAGFIAQICIAHMLKAFMWQLILDICSMTDGIKQVMPDAGACGHGDREEQ